MNTVEELTELNKALLIAVRSAYAEAAFHAPINTVPPFEESRTYRQLRNITKAVLTIEKS
jgi:hypothetical protein